LVPSEAERPARNGANDGTAERAGIGTYLRIPSVRISAVIAVAIAAGVIVWLLVGGSGGQKSVKTASAQAVSAGSLAALPGVVHHPVYWAGPKPGFTYELTRTSDGRIFIRYLPAGIHVGTNQPKYLTIGTYPVKNAVAAVRRIARRGGSAPIPISGGGVAGVDTAHPTSVYLAYPGSAYQIEVFEPSPATARGIALSGRVVRLGSGSGPSQTAAAAPKAVSGSALRSLSSSVGHPVYWAGAIPNTTLELTRTSDGRIYIRYLPAGVSVGDRHPRLTVGTYPVGNAFEAVQTIAQRPGAQRVAVSGGIAVVDPVHPRSVYLASRGSKYQVEVFAPSAALARQLVASGRIVPVR
jgi:hypothetical protein